MGPGFLRVYLGFLSRPGISGLFLSSVVGRLPMGMMGLAVVLAVREGFGSYSAAGGVTAAFALSGGASAVVQGRLMDRLGQTPVLLVCGLGFPSSVAAMLVATESGLLPAVVAAAVATGVTFPPLAACLRASLPRLLSGDAALLRAGYSLDSVVQEAIYLVGPLLVGALVALAAPSAALATAAVAGGIGTLWFATLPASRHRKPARATLENDDGTEREGARGRLGPLRAGGFRVLVAASFSFGVVFGALQIALAAFAEQRGAAGATGLLLATLSLGGIAGGLLFGAFSQRVPSATAYWACFALWAAFLALGALPTTVWQAAIVVALVGLPVPPIMATAYQLAGRVSPEATLTEAFAWLNTATLGGSAAGLAAAGFALSVLAPGWLFLAGAAFAGAAAVLAAAARSSFGSDELERDDAEEGRPFDTI